MPKLAMRDPNTGVMVPVLGGVDNATSDARFAPLANPVFTGLVDAPAPTAASHAATWRYVNTLLPVGAMGMFCGDYVPLGWLHCNGQAISRTYYAELYSLIGTYWGAGDSSTTFNIPNMQGRVAVSVYSGHGGFDGLGDAGGAVDVTVGSAEYPGASGNVIWHGAGSRTSLYGSSGYSTWNTGYIGAYGNPQYPQTGAGSVGTVNHAYSGGGGSHPNVQPSLCIHYMIKW